MQAARQPLIRIDHEHNRFMSSSPFTELGKLSWEPCTRRDPQWHPKGVRVFHPHLEPKLLLLNNGKQIYIKNPTDACSLPVFLHHCSRPHEVGPTLFADGILEDN